MVTVFASSRLVGVANMETRRCTKGTQVGQDRKLVGVADHCDDLLTPHASTSSVCVWSSDGRQASNGWNKKSQLQNSSVYTSYVRQTISRGVRTIEVPQAKFRPPRPTHTRTPDRNPPNASANSGARAVAGACLGHLPSRPREGKWAKNRTAEVPGSPARGSVWQITVRRTLCTRPDLRPGLPSPPSGGSREAHFRASAGLAKGAKTRHTMMADRRRRP